MASEVLDVKAIFNVARNIASPSARVEYLQQVCGDNPELQVHVETLLRAYEEQESFLETPPGGSLPTIDLPVPEKPGSQVGPYKLLEQIGEGGMGTVWMAQQSEPVKRLVALKVIKPGMDSRQVIARFEAERQALALMDHPNIARVLDAGTTDAGRPYFVMDLVRGVPITQYCDQNHLTPRQRLELFIPVCQAVQHAHQKGIIHRDLKPTNVLVALYDGRPVPKVIDFGVAKAAGQTLTEKTLVTGFGAIVGTLEYMSPEQAELNQLDIDTRSDIYSLGVLLYELLAGTTPLERKRVNKTGILEALRIIREEEVPTLSNRLSTTDELPAIAANRGLEPAKLAALVRGELDWIVMKALEKDRNRRYETANGLAMDVQRYLSDEPVQACPPSNWYRFRKFARRNKPTLAAASVMGLAVLLSVAALASSTLRIARQQGVTKKALQAETNALQAETRAKNELAQNLEREQREAYFQRIAGANRELSVDNLGGALELLKACPEKLRGWEWRYLMRLCWVQPVVISNGPEINGLAFSPDPDGERIASAGGDGTIKIWNSRTGDVQTLENAHSDSVVCVAFHPDGSHLASRGTGSDRRVKVWDLTSGKELFNEPCDKVREYGTAYTIAFSADGRFLAAGSDGVVKVWDWENRRLLHSLPGHGVHPIPVAFSHDGRLATGTWREGVKLWNPETGTWLCTAAEHIGPLSAIAFSADGKWVAAASYDRTVKLSDSTTGKHLFTLSHPGNQVECVAIAPDGRRLASGGEDKTVRVWDTTTPTPREILVLRGHTDRCVCVAFSPDGNRLASASFDGTIHIWDATPLRGDEHQELLNFAEHSNEVRSVAFSPDGRWVASIGFDKLVKVWEAQTLEVIATFSHEEFGLGRVGIFCLAWHPQGHLIASGGLDGVRVWDARTAREVVPKLTGAQKKDIVFAVAFSPDGRYLVTGKEDGAVQVWDGETGAEVGTLGSHEREIFGVVFSQGGEHLASASRDGKVKLWDATRLNQTQKTRLTLQARLPGAGVNVAFSPDGRRLASGGKENTVVIWDVQTGDEIRTLRGQHSGEVYTLAFSPVDDGRLIATAGEDSAVKIWDSYTGKLIHSFRGHTGLVDCLAFSSDGRLLVSGSRDTTVKVWDMTQLETAPER